MRRVASALLVVLVVGGMLLTGCGGAGNTHAPMPQVAETGQVRVEIAWPEAEAESRLIMTACQSIKVSVSGGDFSPPITATVNSPTKTATLTVPVGSNRVVDAEGYDAPDATGNQIQKAHQQVTVPEVATGQTYNVTVHLLDMWDHDDDTYSGATPVPTDGTLSGWHVVDGVSNGWRDRYDWFKFTAVAGTWYTIETHDVAGTRYAAGDCYAIYIYDTNGTTLLTQSGTHHVETAVVTWQAPANADYFAVIRADQEPYGTSRFRMEYKLTVNAGGTGDIDVGVD